VPLWRMWLGPWKRQALALTLVYFQGTWLWPLPMSCRAFKRDRSAASVAWWPGQAEDCSVAESQQENHLVITKLTIHVQMETEAP
jgi:hypothetical protein